MIFRKSVSLPEYVRLNRKSVNYARIRVVDDASVELTVPPFYRDSDIVDLLQRKQGWIEEKRRLAQGRLHQRPLFDEQRLLWQGQDYLICHHARREDQFVLDPEARLYSRQPLDNPEQRIKWYRRKAREVFAQRLLSLAAEHGLAFSGLSVRDQRSRWGSCSSSGRVSLNWRLILAPVEVSDYVLMHELAHTRHMNHSREFWQLVATMAPHYRQAKQWLRENGQGLMLYLQAGSSP